MDFPFGLHLSSGEIERLAKLERGWNASAWQQLPVGGPVAAHQQSFGLYPIEGQQTVRLLKG
jgi:hypothetical protein